MRRALLTIVLTAFVSLVAAHAWANPAMDGTWRVAVMKEGTKKTSLSKPDYLLVLVFDDADKTWSATVKSDDDEAETEKRSGTYTSEGEKVTLTESGSKKSHDLRVVVKGKQMVISPTDEPSLRLVALKVE